jgi:hypothetical protein
MRKWVLDDAPAIFCCDFHDGEAVLQFAGLVAADHLCYSFCGDIGGIFDLPTCGGGYLI